MLHAVDNDSLVATSQCIYMVLVSGVRFIRFYATTGGAQYRTFILIIFCTCTASTFTTQPPQISFDELKINGNIPLDRLKNANETLQPCDLNYLVAQQSSPEIKVSVNAINTSTATATIILPTPSKWDKC